jgi:hypothetical protein
MSLNQTIEDHIVLFFLGTLAIGFTAGWGAFSAIQLATGHTSISVDRLRQLEGPEAQEKKALLDKLGDLETELALLQQQLLTNRPKTGNYVRNIVVEPSSPAELKVGAGIKVKFDYVLSKGDSATIWAKGDGPTSYKPASPVTGFGTDERGITGLRPG